LETASADRESLVISNEVTQFLTSGAKLTVSVIWDSLYFTDNDKTDVQEFQVVSDGLVELVGFESQYLVFAEQEFSFDFFKYYPRCPSDINL
jgi:hypothetical protein